MHRAEMSTKFAKSYKKEKEKKYKIKSQNRLWILKLQETKDGANINS